jgi:hypothetical protein
MSMGRSGLCCFNVGYVDKTNCLWVKVGHVDWEACGGGVGLPDALRCVASLGEKNSDLT